MLISGELYQSLREGGAGDESAMSAAALLADHQMRLRKLEEQLTWVVRAGFGIGVSILVSAMIFICSR